jgi:hypothetical protein
VRSASVSLGNSKFNPKDACCGALLNTCSGGRRHDTLNIFRASGGCRYSKSGNSRVRRISGTTVDVASLKLTSP